MNWQERYGTHESFLVLLDNLGIEAPAYGHEIEPMPIELQKKILCEVAERYLLAQKIMDNITN